MIRGTKARPPQGSLKRVVTPEQKRASLTIIIIIIIIIVSEPLFCLCRGTNNSTLFGVCPTFRSRTTAFIIFFFFSMRILIFAGARKTQEETL